MNITNFMSFGFNSVRPMNRLNSKNYNNNQISFEKRTNFEKYRDEITKMHYEGKSIKDIANHFNCSRTGISNAIKRWNLGKKGNAFEINKDYIIELYSEGKSIEEIIKITGCKEGHVKRTVEKYEKELRKIIYQENCAQIAELYKSGLKQKEIGAIMGYKQNSVSRILSATGNNKARKEKVIGIVDKNKDEIIRLYEEGESFQEIADRFQCSIGAIQGGLRRWNIEKRPRYNTEYYKDEIIEAYKMGAYQEEIADVLGYTQQTISTALEKWGVTKKHKKARRAIVEQNKDLFIKAVEQNKSKEEIAKELDCSISTIWRAFRKQGENKE